MRFFFSFAFSTGKEAKTSRRQRRDRESVVVVVVASRIEHRSTYQFVFHQHRDFAISFLTLSLVSLVSLNSRSRPPLFTSRLTRVLYFRVEDRNTKKKKRKFRWSLATVRSPFRSFVRFVSGYTWNTVLRFGISSKFIRYIYVCVYVTTEFTSMLCKNWTFDRKGGKTSPRYERKKMWNEGGERAREKKKRNETKRKRSTFQLIETMNARNHGTKAYILGIYLNTSWPSTVYIPPNSLNTKSNSWSFVIDSVTKRWQIGLAKNGISAWYCFRYYSTFTFSLSLSFSPSLSLSLSVYRVRIGCANEGISDFRAHWWHWSRDREREQGCTRHRQTPFPVIDRNSFSSRR